MMAPKQKMRLANEKHSKNVTNRGNVPKSLVSHMCCSFSAEQLIFLKLSIEYSSSSADLVYPCSIG